MFAVLFERFKWELQVAGAMILTAAVCLGIGYGWGGLDERVKAAAAEVSKTASAAAAASRLQADRDSRSTAIAVTTASATARQAAITETLKNEVHTYVTPKADARCVITRGAVELHDAAVAGDLAALPRGAGGVDDPAGNVALSDLDENDVDNYSACNIAIARLNGLQAWVKANEEPKK